MYLDCRMRQSRRVTLVPRERAQGRVAERFGDVLPFREEIVNEEAPETASQDPLLQRVQESGPSWTMSRLPKLPFRIEFLKGCVNSPALSRCLKFFTRRMSRQPKIFFRSEFQQVAVNRARLWMLPRSQAKAEFAARGGADDRCDRDLRHGMRGLAAYSNAVSR